MGVQFKLAFQNVNIPIQMKMVKQVKRVFIYSYDQRHKKKKIVIFNSN